MKFRYTARLACTLLWAVPLTSLAASELDIVVDAKPAATIVMPNDPPKWTRQAADWLQEYVEKVSGARLPVLPEGKAPAGTLISVGHTRLFAKQRIELSRLRWDGCRLLVRDNVLYLVGLDNAGTATHDYVGARGTCRAVIKFLEDHCGIRWFLPGPQGAFLPKSKKITVPADLDVRFQPAMAFCNGRSVYDKNILDNPGNTIAAQANNYRMGIRAQSGGHTYYAAVPVIKHLKDRPEYFAVRDGVRGKSAWTPETQWRGHHLCSTNPNIRRLLTEFVRSQFDKGTDWMSLGQEDGYLRCQCEKCEAIDSYRGMVGYKRWEAFQHEKLRDKPPERLFHLHKAVIDDVAKSHPDKTVMLMCYAPTAWPSKEIKYFGDNVVGELMNLNPDYIDAWQGKTNGLAGYTYWFNTQIPMGLNVHMTAKEVADRIQYLHRNNFVALSIGPEATWGLEGPVFYMAGRLMGEPNLVYEAVVREYCDGVFGKAAEPMMEFFALLQDRLAQVAPITDDDISADARNTRLPGWLDTKSLYLAQYPPGVLSKLDGLIRQAEAAADTERNKRWVQLSRDQFDFARLLTEMLVAERAWQTKRTTANWRELKDAVDAFEVWREKIVKLPPEYTDAWWPGHATFCRYLVANLDDTGIAFYRPWNERKAEVLEKGIRGRAMGYGTSYYYSFIREPLTLDFSKPE